MKTLHVLKSRMSVMVHLDRTPLMIQRVHLQEHIKQRTDTKGSNVSTLSLLLQTCASCTLVWVLYPSEQQFAVAQM